jgi:hypothetical protein
MEESRRPHRHSGGGGPIPSILAIWWIRPSQGAVGWAASETIAAYAAVVVVVIQARQAGRYTDHVSQRGSVLGKDAGDPVEAGAGLVTEGSSGTPAVTVEGKLPDT